MALCVVQGPEVSVQQRGLAYESYLRLTISIAPSISMNTNGCEQIPEMKAILCRNGIGELSMTEEPH